MKNLTKKETIHIIFLAAAFICAALLLGGCAAKAVTEEASVMNTIMRVSLYGTEDQALDVIDVVKEADDKFSKTAAASEIFALNHSMGTQHAVSEETYNLIENIVEIADKTHGAYNPALGTVIDLWGIGTEHQGVPGETSLSSALNKTDYKQIVLGENNTVSLGNTLIDLGGAVKGYALDLTRSELNALGVDSAVVSIGGSIYARGTKPDGAKYKVGIRDPYRESQDYFATIELEDACVSTSGTYERGFYAGDDYYHHIFDPKTGYPADNGLVSVTVIDPNGLNTDIYSTALFVMGLNEGFEFAEQNGIAAVFVTYDKKVYLTKDVGYAFTITDDEYEIQDL